MINLHDESILNWKEVTIISQLVKFRPEAKKGLVVVAAIAFTLVAAIILVSEIPYSQTVRQDIPFDILWRESFWQQVTGFLLLGISLLGLLMSLRKRWTRLRFGSLASWRMLHGILGVTGLVVLVAHTGMRFGSNLNFALMIVFVVSNLGGALVASAIGSQHQLAKPVSASTRKRLIRIHVLLLSPLPVLVALHILSVYYF